MDCQGMAVTKGRVAEWAGSDVTLEPGERVPCISPFGCQATDRMVQGAEISLRPRAGRRKGWRPGANQRESLSAGKVISSVFDNSVDHLVGETEAQTKMGQQAGPHSYLDYLGMYTSYPLLKPSLMSQLTRWGGEAVTVYFVLLCVTFNGFISLLIISISCLFQ